MDDLVDMIGRDSRLGRSRSDVENLPSHLAHLPHPFLLFLVEYLDLVPAHEDLLSR